MNKLLIYCKLCVFGVSGMIVASFFWRNVKEFVFLQFAGSLINPDC
jgi:hypothetical protein